MRNPYDHKLFSKIRNTLRNYEAPYDPSDWEALKQRLPAKRPRPFYKRYAVALVLFLFFVSGSAVYVLTTYTGGLPAQNTFVKADFDLNEIKKDDLGTNPSKVLSKDVLSNSSDKPSVMTPFTDSRGDKSVSSALLSKESLPDESESSALAALSTEKAVNTRISDSGKANSISGRFEEKTLAKASASSGEENKKIISADEVAALTFERLEKVELTAPDYVVLSASEFSDVITAFEISELFSEEAEAESAKEKKHRKKSFEAGLALMPVMHSNHYLGGSETTFDLGGSLQITYRLNRNLSIITGAMLFRNNYRTSINNNIITPLHDFDNNIPSTEYFEAQNIQVNIPVMLRLNVLGKEKTKVYAQAGFGVTTSLGEQYMHRSENDRIRSNSHFTEQNMKTERHEAFSNTKLPGNVTAGVGLRHELSEAVNIELETFRMQTLSKSAWDSYRFNTIGLAFRCNFLKF